jgi:hypothetical protein
VGAVLHVLVLLLLITGGVSGSKLRSWHKYPDVNPWAVGSPSPRDSHKMVVGSDGALWSFGGERGSLLSAELFKLDVQTEEWKTITTSGVSPTPRSGHTMGSTDGFLWVFGGATRSDYVNPGCSNELWRLCLATLEWTRIEVPSDSVAPSARYDHVMTSVGLDLWLHGGSTDSDSTNAELWRFDTSTLRWETVDSTTANGVAPSGRFGHVMTSVGRDLWLHGGMTDGIREGGLDDSDDSATLWRFDTSTCGWEAINNTAVNGAAPA